MELSRRSHSPEARTIQDTFQTEEEDLGGGRSESGDDCDQQLVAEGASESGEDPVQVQSVRSQEFANLFGTPDGEREVDMVTAVGIQSSSESGRDDQLRRKQAGPSSSTCLRPAVAI
jgi:hypothetical protein